MAGLFHVQPKKIFLALALGSILAVGLVFGFAQRPRGAVPQTRPRTVARSQAGTLTKVPANGDLQAALNSAKCGETIVVEAGATYVAPPQQSFILANKPQCPQTRAEFITITTSDLTNL
ncbi:MAG: hypothetical protein ACREBC_28830, partial [Pyrinomonadaceae bacterium]